MSQNRRAFFQLGMGAGFVSTFFGSQAEGGIFHKRRAGCVPTAPVQCYPPSPTPTAGSDSPPTVYQLPDGSYAFASSHDFKIGTAHWITFKREGNFPNYKFYKCDKGCDVYAVISHPRIEDIVNQINNCLNTAEVAAAVATIIAAVNGASGGVGGVAVGTFKATLIVCLVTAGVNDASSIDVHLRTDNFTENCHPI